MFFLYINISILDNSHCLKLNKGCDVLCLLPLLLRSIPSDNDAADLQDLLSDYEWELMQSESLDTSIDNASICRTADNTADIVQCYCVPISSWLLSLAVCYVLYSAASLEIDIMHYNDEELLSFPLTAFAAPAAVPSSCILHLF